MSKRKDAPKKLVYETTVEQRYTIEDVLPLELIKKRMLLGAFDIIPAFQDYRWCLDFANNTTVLMKEITGKYLPDGSINPEVVIDARIYQHEIATMVYERQGEGTYGIVRLEPINEAEFPHWDIVALMTQKSYEGPIEYWRREGFVIDYARGAILSHYDYRRH